MIYCILHNVDYNYTRQKMNSLAIALSIAPAMHVQPFTQEKKLPNNNLHKSAQSSKDYFCNKYLSTFWFTILFSLKTATAPWFEVELNIINTKYFGHLLDFLDKAWVNSTLCFLTDKSPVLILIHTTFGENY